MTADSPHSLRDGAMRWPVIDGIAYLRVGREDLARRAMACLDRADRVGALVLLLADQDDWWDGPTPDVASLHRLVEQCETLTLRDAMALLAYGRVGDYFAHRWSDPTFLAGLALLQAHWSAPATAFELACGIGHYLRELQRCGVAVTGGDVVFSKLWLARHWVVGAGARLVCFDASGPWPLAGRTYDLVLCQDAFYFLEPKDRILAALRDASRKGALRVGHIHNAGRANASAGHGLSVAALRTMFPEAVCYDDGELTQALADAREPVPASDDALREADAFAVADGLALPPRCVSGGIAEPFARSPLQRNPLYGTQAGLGTVSWPSERYAQDYAALATYPLTSDAPLRAVARRGNAIATRRREFVDLPERW